MHVMPIERLVPPNWQRPCCLYQRSGSTLMDTQSESFENKRRPPLKGALLLWRHQLFQYTCPTIHSGYTTLFVSFAFTCAVALVVGDETPLSFFGPLISSLLVPSKFIATSIASTSTSAILLKVPIGGLSCHDNLSSIALTRSEGTTRPLLLIQPVVDRITFPSDASCLQNTNYL